MCLFCDEAFLDVLNQFRKEVEKDVEVNNEQSRGEEDEGEESGST